MKPNVFKCERCQNHRYLTALQKVKTQAKEDRDMPSEVQRAECSCSGLPLTFHAPVEEKPSVLGPEWLLLDALGHISPGIAPQRGLPGAQPNPPSEHLTARSGSAEPQSQ